ncbi:hypothetical protein PspLS_03548 [Pyricularia sp. CBS 133598]|nr:hypothetical protein PspLS_03548 [Pyricularia sp. CBS 133598]
MSFAIEVPGEASPLNLQELCSKLLQAGSADHNQRQSASQQLTAWEAYPDYYAGLQTVFLDKSVQREVRYLAIILLKNGIDKGWRSISAKSSIPPAQKNIIRSRLLEGSINEDDKNLALHNALATAKVVRIDYPAEWPTAISDMVGFVSNFRTGNQQHLNGSLLVLLRAVKELAKARLRKSQTALQQVTPELVMLLGEVYSEQVNFWTAFLANGQGGEDDADYAMENSLICLRILRVLVTVGYEYPHRDQLVREFWQMTQTQFGQFLGHVSHDSAVPAPYQEVVGKHLLQFTKLHLEVCETLPTDFALLPNSVELVHAYWDLVAKFAEVFDKSGGIQISSSGGDGGSKSKVEGPLLERLALKGLLLIRGCVAMICRPLQTFKYKSPEAKQEQAHAKELIKTQLITDQFVTQIVDVIITKLFIFRKADLNAWEEDPQEWEAQERDSGDAWQWEVRPCAERVFLDLLIQWKGLLGPPLLNYFQSTAKADADIVTKEAVYTAMGCAAPTVYKLFDFDTFVTSTVVQDVQTQGDLAKLLRRRIAILLSQWVPINISDATRPVVFEIYKHLMNPADQHNDQVVRITAARQFRKIADDFEFKGEIFQPHAYEILTRLISLLTELEQDETKLAILDTVRLIIDRMETTARQVGDQLIEALPKLWEQAGDEAYMLKQSILAILTALVNSVGTDSQKYHPFIVPLISQAMDPTSEISKFLIDEAAEVWKATIAQCSPPVSPEFMHLELKGLPFIEFGNVLSEELVQVVKTYVLLAPENILSDDYRRPTLQALATGMESKQKDQVHHAAKAIDYLLRVAQELGGSEGLTVVVQDMLEIGFLRVVLERIHEAWEARQTTGPQRRSPQISSVKETHYFSILARIALGEPRAFVQLMTAAGDLAAVWKWMVDEWFGCFDMMADVEKQKLSCLALTRLCELAAADGSSPLRDLVLSRLQDYFAMWTSVITELLNENGQGDSLVWDGKPEEYANDWDTPQDVRDRAFAYRDQVHTEHAFPFVQVILQGLVQAVGGEASFQEQWAVNVDKDVIAGFQSLSARYTGS